MGKKRNRRERRERRGGGPPRSAPMLSESELRELEGRPDNNTGDGVFPADRVTDLSETTDTNTYEGYLETGIDDDARDGIESLELLTERELLAGETDDAYEASQEGLTYVPPISAPTWSQDAQGEAATRGSEASLIDDFDGAAHELAVRVRDALRADSSTAAYADRVQIVVSGGRVALRGTVDELSDADNLASVAGDVADVAEVIDELAVRALEGGPS
jgi:hypothetical protein